MILLNFAHPLTAAQRAAIKALAGRGVERTLDLPAQFDAGQPYAAQALALVDSAGLSPEEWQTLPLLVNLPGHSAIAAVVLAEIHGRCGYFPTVVRLRPGGSPPQFEVTELIDLQSVRDEARRRR